MASAVKEAQISVISRGTEQSTETIETAEKDKGASCNPTKIPWFDCTVTLQKQ